MDSPGLRLQPELNERATREARKLRLPWGRSARGPADLSVRLERDPRAPALARAALRAFSEQSDLCAAPSATLALLVSELVSNAVLHSDAPPASVIVVRARLLGEQGAVRVEVLDAGSSFAARHRDRATGACGYGLFLVEEQATRWGVQREGGTCVWFELVTRAGVLV